MSRWGTRQAVVGGLTLLTATVWLLGWGLLRREASIAPAPANPLPGATNATTPLAQFESELRRIDETVWAHEWLAQQCGRTVESMWDAFNASSISNRWSLIQEWDLGRVILGQWGVETAGTEGTRSQASKSGGPDFDAPAWKQWLAEWQRSGWQVEGVEFRHRAFDPPTEGRSAHSRWSIRVNVCRLDREPVERRTFVGDVEVDWGDRDKASGLWRIKQVDASRLLSTARAGPKPLVPILSETIEPLRRGGAIDPILVQDLDGDGTPEILLPAVNRLYRRTGPDRYAAEPLVASLPTEVLAAVVTDLDADGLPDLVVADRVGLLLWQGVKGGRFAGTPRRIWSPTVPWVNPTVMAAADINGDGRVDLFVGQYRVPTLGQILSPSFHAALDGHPAYLLVQDGKGGFRDETDSAGLSEKRRRRVYSALFAAFGRSRNLDLAMASDFAGLDFFRNEGAGKYSDITSTGIPEPHAFGMGLTVADFNRDGIPDLLLIGMNSPTVDRLDHLGLRRADDASDPGMRSKMTWGNRLLLGRRDGGFDSSPRESDLARSGWSWGSAALDVDNDGWPDVYVANGHESGRTVHDYESEFWLHDIFIGRSVDDRTATSYFLRKQAATRGDGWSYGGYEWNRLYLNRGDAGFCEAGYAYGVALPQDCRNVVAADLDGDGRMDLIVSTFEIWPTARQTLRIFRNSLPPRNHWMGFHLRRPPGGVPVEGTQIRVSAGGRTTVAVCVNGDSFRSQNPVDLHFGLGDAATVDSIEILWPGKSPQPLASPRVDVWYSLLSPSLESSR